METLVDVEDHGAVRVLVMNRPDARNALNLAMLDALRAALADASEAGIRALVLTGRGKGFCAGADVREWQVLADDPEADPNEWVRRAHRLVVEVSEFPRPVVAVLNGAAVGAGLDLALACDFRVAADDARFACAYTWMAYPPDAGGTWFLPRIVGLEAAKRFVFTGETWDAAEALRRGLISEVQPRDGLLEAGMAFARALAEGPSVAQGHAKRLLDTSFTRSLTEQLVEEMLAGEACSATADSHEALAAAGERRAPRFLGR